MLIESYFIFIETKKSKLIKRIPKGMSEYQASWIPDIEEKDCSDSDDDDMSDDDDEEKSDDEDFMSCEDKDSADEFEKDDNEEECDTVTVSEAPVNDEKYDLSRLRLKLSLFRREYLFLL